jgi:uncharacterized ferritin-like protein (DUF455 family)
VKIVEKHGANTEMRFVTRVRIVAETLEAAQADATPIVNSAMKDATPDAIIVEKRDVVSIAVIP